MIHSRNDFIDSYENLKKNIIKISAVILRDTKII